MRWGVAAIVLLFLAPSAAAAEVAGQIDAGREITIPGGARLVSAPLALFVPNVSAPLTLAGVADLVTVQVFEDHYVTAPLPGARPVVATGTSRPVWTLRETTLTAASARPGWIGLHATDGVLQEDAKDPLRLTLGTDIVLGNGQTGPDDTPDLPYYSVSIRGATISRSSMAWSYSGAGLIKIMGPTVTLTARENTTTIETGEMPDPANPAQTMRRHLVIGFTSVRLDARVGTSVASASVQASWDGGVDLAAAQGSLVGGFREWRANGGSERMEGRFSSQITADPTRHGLIMDLEGDLRSSTFASQVILPASASSAGPWLFLAAAALVTTGAATAVLMRRHRNRSGLGPLHADEVVVLAERAAEEDDYERAAKLMEFARRQSPTSVRLALDHAYYVFRSEGDAAAIRMLHDPLIADDPDALLFRCRLCLTAGREDEAALAITRALSVSSLALLEVESDEAYSSLVSRADVRAAIREARRRLS